MVPGVPHEIQVSNPESIEKQKSVTLTLQPDENREIQFDFSPARPRVQASTPSASPSASPSAAPAKTVQVRIGAQVNQVPVAKASITLDGRPIDDETTCTLELAVGRHEIVVTRTIDGVAWVGRRTVELAAGMARQDIQIEMRPGR